MKLMIGNEPTVLQLLFALIFITLMGVLLAECPSAGKDGQLPKTQTGYQLPAH